MNNPIRPSNRRRQRLIGAGAITIFIYIAIAINILTGKDGIGGYWWMYLSPLGLWLIIAGMMFARRHFNVAGAVQDTLFIVLTGFFISVFGGAVAVFTLLLVNDCTVSKRESVKVSVEDISCRYSKKKGTFCTVYFKDRQGNEYDADMYDHLATPFKYLDSAAIEISTGVLGGRFIDVDQFRDSSFVEAAERIKKR